jgi:hypothetical protein
VVEVESMPKRVKWVPKTVSEYIKIYPSEISFITDLEDGGMAGSSYLFTDLRYAEENYGKTPDQVFEEALAEVNKQVRKWWKEYKKIPKSEL